MWPLIFYSLLLPFFLKFCCRFGGPMSHLSYLLIEITRSVFDMQSERVNRTANFVDDLGADSLDCVELMMALEDAFDIEFADDELSGLTTISALEDYFLHCVAENPSFRSLMSA